MQWVGVIALTSLVYWFVVSVARSVLRDDDRFDV